MSQTARKRSPGMRIIASVSTWPCAPAPSSATLTSFTSAAAVGAAAAASSFACWYCR
jgi:hypothetical protein